jgi:hypothetical protein
LFFDLEAGILPQSSGKFLEGAHQLTLNVLATRRKESTPISPIRTVHTR